jgi:uncharacterized protein (AIM24 family)
MAKFEIEKEEGMHWIKATLNNEAMRAVRGALSYMQGDIKMDLPLPTLRAIWASMFTKESYWRPRYRGTGEIVLESSVGGFYSLDVQEGEQWVVEDGAYWASEEAISLGVYRERMLTAFWAGEGLLWYQTKVSGRGRVVLISSGPVEVMTLNNQQLVVDGSYVLARTVGLKFTIRRPARGLLGYILSGERPARVYEGTGRLLFCPTPFWRLRIVQGKEFTDPILTMM